jgi:hypothetical protein
VQTGSDTYVSNKKKPFGNLEGYSSTG